MQHLLHKGSPGVQLIIAIRESNFYVKFKGKGYAESSRSPEFLQKKEAVEPLQKGMGTSPKK
ncbi:MAG: hypothetical protein LKE24_07420 [Dialister sp.]|nr:hypothetical protein [Dialister sp.]